MANLTINFVPPTPVCINGFKVKYRKVGTASYITVIPNPTTSPVNIAGVEDGATYEGTIQSDCSNSIYSEPIKFTVSPCVGIDKKYINGICTTANKQYIGSVANSGSTGYTCTFIYVFADGSRSPNLTEQSTTACS